MLVTTLATQYVDGKRRYGSRGMGPDGKFALHLDYLAGALDISVAGVKNVRQSLTRKGWLVEVYPATHGRPATWRALVVRGDESGDLEGGQPVPPYHLRVMAVWGDKTDPLTYKTPDDPDHETPARVPPSAPNPGQAQQGKASDPDAGSPAHGCEWHEYVSCPDDCKNADHDREVSA